MIRTFLVAGAGIMSIFQFHIEDGTFEHAVEQLELPNLEAARLHAAAVSQALIAEGVGRFARGEAWQMHVTDELGCTCCSLKFAAVPAAERSSHSYSAMAAEAFQSGSSDEVTLRGVSSRP
jgi:hypothetical protein